MCTYIYIYYKKEGFGEHLRGTRGGGNGVNVVASRECFSTRLYLIKC